MKIQGNYMLDIENIIKYVFDTDSVNSDSEITDLCVMDDENKNLMLSTKQVREVKSSDDSNKQTIKYDLVKMLIMGLMEMDADNATFGDVMLMNTMLNEGLMKEIDGE